MLRHRALDYLSGLPAFAAYFGLALALLAAFVFIYIRFTPYRELQLIREGNAAAAASLGGAMIGFALPVASAIENSVSLLDMLMWAAIALLVQGVAFQLVRLLVPTIASHVQDGKMASGIFLGAASIAIGLLNASAMSW